MCGDSWWVCPSRCGLAFGSGDVVIPAYDELHLITQAQGCGLGQGLARRWSQILEIWVGDDADVVKTRDPRQSRIVTHIWKHSNLISFVSHQVLRAPHPDENLIVSDCRFLVEVEELASASRQRIAKTQSSGLRRRPYFWLKTSKSRQEVERSSTVKYSQLSREHLHAFRSVEWKGPVRLLAGSPHAKTKLWVVQGSGPRPPLLVSKIGSLGSEAAHDHRLRSSILGVTCWLCSQVSRMGWCSSRWNSIISRV